MHLKISKSNIFILRSCISITCMLFTLFNINVNDSNADILCAINVAIAAPLTPILNFPTNSKSKNTFIIEEKTKNASGVLESPNALKDDVDMLYINKKIAPKK